MALMAQPTSARTAATRDSLLGAAVGEFSLHGFRRASMEGVARGAGVSRATLYLHFGSKEELFRALVERLHDEHVEAMRAAAEAEAGDFEGRVVAVLEARFGRWVELTAASPHAAELYDLHGRLCGDVARASQARSEKILAAMLRAGARRGEIDLERVGLSAARTAGVLFDAAHGAKGEDPAVMTPAEFRERLGRIVRVLVRGLQAR